MFEAEVTDEQIAKHIIDGLIDSVSVGVEVTRIKESGMMTARNYAFKELSLVITPACKYAKISDIKQPS